MLQPDIDEIMESVLGYCEEIDSRITRFGITCESIAAGQSHADLILMPLCQIGELAQRNRDALESAVPQIPWHQIAGLRNVIVHGYTTLDAESVWNAAVADVPKLARTCADYIR